MPVPTVDLGPAGSSYDETYYENIFTQEWGAKAGAAYAAYNKGNPGRTPYQNAQAFASLVLVEGLDRAIAAGITAGANVDTGTAQGAAKGAEKAVSNLTNPFKWLVSVTGISGHNLLVRTLKVVFGGVLLIAGIVKMTGADKAALGIVGTVAGKIPGV